MKMFCKSLALLFVLGTVAFAWDCPIGQHLVQTDGGKFVVAGKHFSCEKDGGNEIKNTNKNKNDNTNISKSTASASAGASASGGDASNSNNTTNIAEASKIPVSTAYAPTALPTVPCFKGYGGGAQTSGFGFSLGGGKVDEGCNAREDARSYMLMGSRTAACKIMITQKASKKAHITMEDCMASDVSNGTEVDSMVPAVIGSDGMGNMTILDNGASHNQTPGISEAFNPIDGTLSNLSTSPMPTQNAIGIIGKDTSRDRVIGVCTFANSQTKCQAVQTSPKHVTDICDVMLEEARRALHEDSTALLKLEGNRNKQEDVVLDIERTMATRVKLVNMGVDPNRIIMTYGNSGERTVVITLIHSNPWN